MTAARRTPRAAGWIVGRFVGSGHFNISPEHALEVAPGTAHGPERAIGGAGAAVRARITRSGRSRSARRSPPFVGRNENGERVAAGATVPLNGSGNDACAGIRTRDIRPMPDAWNRHHGPRHAGTRRVPAPRAQRVAAPPSCGRTRPRCAAITRRARRPPGRPPRSTNAAPHTRATAASLRCGVSGW